MSENPDEKPPSPRRTERTLLAFILGIIIGAITGFAVVAYEQHQQVLKVQKDIEHLQSTVEKVEKTVDKTEKDLDQLDKDFDPSTNYTDEDDSQKP